MRQEILRGAERRRRWSDEQKLAILSEVGDEGWSVAEVARRHDLSRQQVYQWRRELVRKGLIPVEPTVFLPVTAEAAEGEETPETRGRRVEVGLAKGRTLTVTTDVPAIVLQRLIRTVETA
ncbi:MAG: transposase [Azospirillaceae bacterium]